MNIDNVSVGDKFSTENKLLNKLGCPKTSGNSRLAQLKDVKRYIDYTKTGKISRGKETNEIIIVDKYEKPKQAKDGRTSEVIKYIKPLITQMDSKSIGNKRLFLEEFKIADKEVWETNNGDNVIEFYKYYLLNDFKAKVKTALKQIYKEIDTFYFSYDYLLINKQGEKWEYTIADHTQSEYIDTIKKNIKDRIMARHKLENPNDRNKTWRHLSYRYNSTVYKLVNEEIKDVFDMDKCVDVVTIQNNETPNEKIDENQIRSELRKYYKSKMSEWVKSKSNNNISVADFHNKIFFENEDVK